MTLKTRNQMNLFLLGLFSLSFLIQLSLLIWSFVNGTINISTFIKLTKTSDLFFKNQTFYYILGIFFQNLFVIINCWVTHRSFVKTQGSEVPFYLIFLLAIFTDTFRLLIIIFNLSSSFSELYIFCGNASLFSKILAPLSLLLMTCLPYSKQKQNSDTISLICILISLFISSIIPLNTAITLENFSVDYSFKILVILFTICAYFISAITLFFTNKANGYNQKTTIGLIFLILGVYSIRYAMNFFVLILAITELTLGSIFFVKQLHNHYLWKD